MNNFLITNKNALKDYDNYDYHPKNTMELRDNIIKLLQKGITDLNCIDVSNVIYMSYLFCCCNKFDSDLSKWNVSNVNDMQFMFHYCTEFNSDISKWDVSNVTEMSNIFDGCTKLFTQNKFPYVKN